MPIELQLGEEVSFRWGDFYPIGRVVKDTLYTQDAVLVYCPGLHRLFVVDITDDDMHPYVHPTDRAE